MANIVKLKRSSVQGKVPTTSDLELGELGLNTYDGKLYAKKDDGTLSIFEIGPISEAPNDGYYYVRQNQDWVNQDISLVQRYVIGLDGGDFNSASAIGAYMIADSGNFNTGNSAGVDLEISGGIF